MKKNIKQKIAHSLDIPNDMLCDVPHFTLTDNREIRIENYKGILSYTENEINLGAKNYKIKIAGDDLKITVITDEFIIIVGSVSAVSFV